MAVTFAENNTSRISLEEYLEVLSRLDLRDPDALVSTVPEFVRLLNDPNIVVNALNEELIRAGSGVAVDPESSLILGRARNKIQIRANIWTALDDSMEPWEHSSYFSDFTTPHNHDYDFLTGGYIGPGYETEIYHFEGDYIDGKVGDEVDLSFSERTKLEPGKVMYYYRSSDVHFQEYPSSLSVSLQVLRRTPGDEIYALYGFDLKNRKITRVNPKLLDWQLTAIELARVIYNERTANLLEQIATAHPLFHCRSTSWCSLASIAPNRSSEVLKMAESDKDDRVAAAVHRYCEALLGGAQVGTAEESHEKAL